MAQIMMFFKLFLIHKGCIHSLIVDADQPGLFNVEKIYNGKVNYAGDIGNNNSDGNVSDISGDGCAV